MKWLFNLKPPKKHHAGSDGLENDVGARHLAPPMDFAAPQENGAEPSHAWQAESTEKCGGYLLIGAAKLFRCGHGEYLLIFSAP